MVKNTFTIIAVTIIGFLLISMTGAYAFDTPPLQGRVNDYAHVLTPDQITQLDNQLAVIENTLPNHPQVVVLTVPSLLGQDIDSVVNKIFNDWKLGRAGINNGLLEFISVGDRKIRLEVGDGLRNKISNNEAVHIINTNMSPNLHSAGNYFQAFTDATSTIAADIIAPTPPMADYSVYFIFGGIAVLAVVFGFLMIVIFRAVGSRSNIASAPAPYKSYTGSASVAPAWAKNNDYYEDDNSAMMTGIVIGEAIAASNHNNYYPPNYIPTSPPPSVVPSYDPPPVSTYVSSSSDDSSSYSSSSSSYDSGSSSSSFDSGGGFSSGGGGDGSF